jgi:uncharacterized protein YjbJ (UPF0337 family)
VNSVKPCCKNVTLLYIGWLTFMPWKLFHKSEFNNMNTTELNGKWNEQKGKLKQKFASLTDNDLLFAEGKKDEMLGRLQVKLGKSKEELHKLLEAL